MFEFQNSENSQTIVAKFQNGRLTIIHSSLCSNCIHIDDKKKKKSKKVQSPKMFKFQNSENF